MDQNINELPSARSAYAILGLALCLMASVSMVVQVIIGVLNAWFVSCGYAFVEADWYMWAETVIPVYVFALPSAMLTLRLLPKDHAVGAKFGVGRYFLCLPIAFFFMYSGSVIGTVLSAVLSFGTATNAVQQYAFDTSILKIIVLVIVAPIMEELTFRKTIIDRCARYGEAKAVLFSAVAFSLFHMNLYQTFYAFGLGLILGYMYMRTRRIQYSILLHMIINFCGGTLVPWVLSLSADNMFGVLMYCCMAFIIVGLFITGLVLFIKNVKKVRFAPAAMPMEKGTAFRTMFIHVGTIGFVILCVLVCVVALMA